MKIDLELIENLEDIFRSNRYDGNLNAKNYYKYLQGSIPVILSAPHTTNHVNAKGNFKMSDAYTGSIAFILQKLTNCHLIYLTKQDQRNPNSEWNSEYKDEISNIIKNNKINILIDLHSMSKTRDFDIDFGTNNGNSIDTNNLNIIKNIFNENEITKLAENYYFKASYPTITYFCSEILKTNAIQIEIHKNLREPKNSLKAFLNLINALHTTILTFASIEFPQNNS